MQKIVKAGVAQIVPRARPQIRDIGLIAQAFSTLRKVGIAETRNRFVLKLFQSGRRQRAPYLTKADRIKL